MLDDRDYMRRPEPEGFGWGPRLRWRWSWTVLLLAVYAAVFVLELVVQQHSPGNRLFNGRQVWTPVGMLVSPGYLPLSLEGLSRGYVWQFVSYQFLHADLWHLLFNGMAIYFFGRELESVLGGKRFLALVFSSGIIGGLCQAVVSWLWPQYFGGPVVGASACAFGLVAAFALVFPERELTMLLFFVIPVHLRARTLLLVSAALALFCFGLHDYILPRVAHAAHLGGMVMGVVFVKWMRRSGRPLRGAVFMRVPEIAPEEGSPSEFVESEVNPILDKINRSGVESLTSRERAVLEAARKRMERR